MIKKQWKPIKGYPPYEVNRRGDIRRQLKDGTFKKLTAVDNGNGYLRVNLYKNGVGKKFFIQRLVAEAFISNPNKHPQVHHKDHVKTNNTVENLLWVTSAENNKWRSIYYRTKKVNNEH